VSLVTADTITDDQIRSLRDGEKGLLDESLRDLCRIAMQVGSPAKNPSHPMCAKCGWRKGGTDSWDGYRCKCGHATLGWYICGTCHGMGTEPYNIGVQPCSSCDGSGFVDPAQRILARARLAAILETSP
jgi:hypothetical protein